MSQNIHTLKGALSAAETALAEGDQARALELYSLVLAKAPKHAKAKRAVQRLRKSAGGAARLSQADVDRAVGMLNAGQFEDVVAHVQQLVLIAPKEALLPNMLGMALANLGRSAEAIKAFRKAVRLRAGYAEAWGNLGGALLGEDDVSEAKHALENAVALKPDLTEAQQNLAMALARGGQADDALEMFDRVLAARPDYVLALCNKGGVLRDLGRHKEAISVLERAHIAAPQDSDVLINLGYAFADDDQYDQAVEFLTRASALAPDNSEVPYRLGVLYSQIGKTQQALDLFDHSLTIDPDNARAWRSRAGFVKFAADDAAIAKMIALDDRSPANSDARMHMGFALGKAMEDTGQLERAFDYWTVGNKIRRANTTYDIQDDAKLISRIKRVYSEQVCQGFGADRNPSKRPIFVVGMMRSGTTLVEQILASHSQVFGADELPYLMTLGLDRIKDDTFDPGAASGALSDGYLAELARHDADHAHVVDKMPINFLWIGLIKSAFSNARIINLTRDPRDNCLSIYKNYFDSTGNGYSSDLKELAQFYDLYRDLMAHWDAVLPGQVFHTSYEHFTEDLEGESRRLLDYCGLEWEAGVLDFHKTERIVKTASLDQVRRKIYSSSVGAWRRYETQLAPLIGILTENGHI